jgi:hypothetical protein
MGSLKPDVVDIVFTDNDKTPPDQAGPTGRLENLINTQVIHYEPPHPGIAPKIQLEQRNAFESYSTTSRSSEDGSAIEPDWTNPKLLSSLGDQLLSISNQIPRVWNGTDWTYYSDDRLIINKLSERIILTTQTLMEAPDSAVLNGVTCEVHSQFNSTSQSYDVYVSFVAPSGAWIVMPRRIFTAAENLPGQAKVVADPENGVFWVLSNHIEGGDSLDMRVYTPDGVQVALHNFPISWSVPPGYWDITFSPCRVIASRWVVIVAQPRTFSSSSSDNVEVILDYFSFNGTTISRHSSEHPEFNCCGPVAWVRNGFQPWVDSSTEVFSYLSTVGAFEESNYPITVYKLDNDTNTLFYNVTSTSKKPDSITGFVDSDETAHVAISELSDWEPTYGPPNDPALRQLTIYNVDSDNLSSFFKRTTGIIAQSRSFAVDDKEYLIAYYQSGNGILADGSLTEISHTTGDYMLGSPSQPVLNFTNGDYAIGSGTSYVANSAIIRITQNVTSIAHTAGDSANADTQVWTIQAGSVFDINTVQGSLLNITGDANPDNNHSFRILRWVSNTQVQTEPLSTSSTPMTTSNLTGVTASVSKQTMAYWADGLQAGLPQPFDDTTIRFYLNGSMTVSGSAAGNNTTFIPLQILLHSENQGIRANGAAEGFWRGTIIISNFIAGNVNAGGVGTSTNFAFVPSFPNTVFFQNEGVVIDDASVGSNLTIGNATHFQNIGNHLISSVLQVGPTLELTVAAGMIAEQWASSSIANIRLVDPAQAHRFYLQSVTFDNGFLGSYIIVSDDTLHPNNNNRYQIVQVLDEHTVLTKLGLGVDDTIQENNMFSGSETISIQRLTTSISADSNAAQPCWFLIGVDSEQIITGQFEKGIAYADWRYDGSDVQNIFSMGLTSVPNLGTSITAILPYRAASFTAGQISEGTQVAIQENTIGLKQFFIEAGLGSSISNFGEMLLPGPLAGQFSADGFTEDNISLGFEQPFIYELDTIEQFGLAEKGIYQYIVVAELTNSNGDRVFSNISGPLNVTLSDTQNCIVLAGSLIAPTNHEFVSICIYRTAFINGVQSSEHYLITDPLNPNGSSTDPDINPSGFSFFIRGGGSAYDSWVYTDANPDGLITKSEILYTDKGFLQRFPAPAYSQGISAFKNRTWVVGYDNAIWVSGQKTEGDQIWFNSALRITLPTTDKIVAIAPMDDNLIIGCENSMWYANVGKGADLPSDNGTTGSLPTPVELPFPNGCTGFMIPIAGAVAYSSTAKGVWKVTRNLTNEWLSQPLQNDIINVTGMAIDNKQRLFVATGTTDLFVYDMISHIWANYILPDPVSLITSFDGSATIQDSEFVLSQTNGYADKRGQTLTGIGMDATLASISFAKVKNYTRLWELQILGKYKGPHNLNLTLSEPNEDDGQFVTEFNFTPKSNKPYSYAFNPKNELASSYAIRFWIDFDGIATPANSAVIELFGASVGLEPNISRLPYTARVKSK